MQHTAEGGLAHGPTTRAHAVLRVMWPRASTPRRSVGSADRRSDTPPARTRRTRPALRSLQRSLHALRTATGTPVGSAWRSSAVRYEESLCLAQPATAARLCTPKEETGRQYFALARLTAAPRARSSARHTPQSGTAQHSHAQRSGAETGVGRERRHAHSGSRGGHAYPARHSQQRSRGAGLAHFVSPLSAARTHSPPPPRQAILLAPCLPMQLTD